MRVPFFDYKHLFSSDKNKFLKAFEEICNRGAFIMQDDLSEFEQEIANFCGCNYAVGVGNATDALEILIQAAGIGKGDEVIFCSHTMVATASAIYINGAKPIPVEAGSDHLIDPVSIEQAINSNTMCIMPTQLNGRTANMDEICRIADEYDLLIIEDSAQALGSKYKGKNAGTFGIGGCISFYPAKLLGCFGDGGMILTNSEDINDKVRLIRDHGRDPKTGEVVLWGRNSRLDNLQAALLRYQFKNYKQTIARRRQLAALYHENLMNVMAIILPPPPNGDSDHFDVYQNYEIEAERRDELKTYLFENGIGTLIQWGGKAVHQSSKLGFNVSLPYTEKLFDRMLMLPLNTSLSDDDVLYVCEKVKEFYK